MDPTDFVAKTNAAANTALDILKKEWFLNLVLWLLLIAELSAIWTGRSLYTVVRTVIVQEFGWILLSPVIDGVERTFQVMIGYEAVAAASILMLAALLLGVLTAFWRDGKRLTHTPIVEVASLNLMLRFTLLTTFAMVFGNVVLLVLVLVVTAATFALGATVGSDSRQRIQGFLTALMAVLFLGFVTLLSPFVIATLALWRALR